MGAPISNRSLSDQSDQSRNIEIEYRPLVDLAAAGDERNPKGDALTRRFLRKTEQQGDCLVWTGSRLTKRGGYGQINVAGRVLYAHRLAYELFNGPIPPGLLVRHTCDNPPCVLPQHLILGTYKENSADAVARNRGMGKHNATGTANPAARLIDAQVVDILSLKGKQAAESVGAQYHVSGAMIRRIWKGQAWKHLQPGK